MHRRNFVKLTGAGLPLVAGSQLLMPLSRMLGGSPDESLKQMSMMAFDRYRQVWEFPDFWKRGNTFDACLTFTLSLIKRYPDDPEVKKIQEAVLDMTRKNLAFFRSYDPGGLWADDFGWWGIMALNARKFLLLSGEPALAQEYLSLSTDLCWEYKKRTAYDATDDAWPVPHGCRNGDANGQSLGVKNTVTNVLLFLLSTRIYRMALEEQLPDRDKFLDMAWRQWIWFDSWFDLQEYSYLKMVSPDAGLVQERPMAFVEGSGYTDKTHPTWREGWVWTGDQGMLLQALTDLLAVKDEISKWHQAIGSGETFDPAAFEKRIRQFIRIIGQGIQSLLVGKSDGIIREAPFTCSLGPEFGRDYMAGRGIMMRYLGNPEVASLTGIDFSPAISSTMEAIWQTRDRSTNQFQAEFTSAAHDAKYIAEFRQLWGLADDIRIWESPYPEEKKMVCQSIGFDAMGAVLRHVI